MGKKSRTKRERREGKLASETKPVSLFDSMLTVPADAVVTSLLLKFVGKSGYRYVSVGRYGCLFVNEKYTDVVPVMLHREFPEMSVRGRFNDPNRNDIVLYTVHVPASFTGMVIDKHANVYLTGNPEVKATPEELKNVLCDMTKVTADEFNAALEAERPLIEADLKALKEKVEKDTKESIKDLDAAQKQMEEDTEVSEAEVIDDGTQHTSPVADAPVVDAEEVTK